MRFALLFALLIGLVAAAANDRSHGASTLPNAVATFAGDLNVQRRSQAGSCDVMQYGAKGDGLTEDTAAIQAAIAACDHGSTGGGIVVLPRGKTFLSYPFNMTGNDMVLSVEGTLLGPETPDLKRWTVLPHFPSYQLSRS
eukprot:gene27367-4828_t